MTLLAVSKWHPVASIRAALRYGQTRFGESYAQKAERKMSELAGEPIEWHFIGPLQSNKTRSVAARFRRATATEYLPANKRQPGTQ